MQESGPEDSGLFHNFKMFWQKCINKTAKINKNTSTDKPKCWKEAKTEGNIVTPRPNQFLRVMWI